MSGIPTRHSKCWFFGVVKQNLEQVAALLEDGKPFPEQGWVVVRADDSANIYAIPETLFNICLRHMRESRNNLRGKKMLLKETAFHRNIVETSSGKETFYTFGNFFGSGAVLVKSNELEQNFLDMCVGRKMGNVHIEFGQECGITVGDWDDRE